MTSSLENAGKSVKDSGNSSPNPHGSSLDGSGGVGDHSSTSGFQEPSFGYETVDRKLDAYATMIVRNPWRSLCGCYFIIFLTIFLGFTASGVIIVPNGLYEWYVKDDPASQHSDMMEAARSQDLLTNTSKQSTVALYQLFYYTSEDEKESVFTPKNLQAMCEFEKTLVNFAMPAKDSIAIETTAPAGWIDSDLCPTDLSYDHYCLLDEVTKKCSSPATASGSWSGSLSVVSLFYGDQLVSDVDTATHHAGEWNCKLLAEDVVAAKRDQMASKDTLESDLGKAMYSFFMSKESLAKGYSNMTRSAIALGGPLCVAKGGVAGAGQCFDFASSNTDLFGDQALSYQNNLLAPWVMDEVVERYGLEERFLHPFFYDDIKAGDMTMYTYSLLLQNWESERVLALDQWVVLMSLGFVYLWLFVHTQSFFIASVGVSQIFLSLPAAIFPYAFFLQVKYFGLMQFLTVFVVLGVGADDIFVIVDAWRQSEEAVPEQGSYEDTLIMRLKYALVRTTQAVFNTSFTTAAAFFATAISPIMPIATFGIFSAVVILVNYLLVLTLTPAAVVVNEISKAKGCIPCSGCCCHEGCCCFYCLPGGGPKGPTKQAKSFSFSPNKRKSNPLQSGVSGSTSNGGSGEDAGDAQGIYRSKLLPAYFRLVEHKPSAFLMIGGLTVYLIMSCVWASQLTPPLETEKWLPGEHMLEKAFDLGDDFMSLGDSGYATWQIVWGMEGLNDKDYNEYDPPCSCTESNGCVGDKSTPSCRGKVIYDSQFDLFNPQAQAVIRETCASVQEWACDAEKCGDTGKLVRPGATICFLSHFEQWAMDTRQVYVRTMVGDEAQRRTYMRLLYEFRSEAYALNDPSKSYDSIIGFTDKRDVEMGPSFVVVQASMTMPLLTPLALKQEIEERAEKFLETIPRPDSAKHVFQYTFDWVWSVTQAGTVAGLTQGMAIAFPLAFVALIVATKNWFLSFFACVSVGGIVASVLGYCKLQGWALGTGEAIAGVMVIGLSVDYTIHLAHMYDHAAHEVDAQSRYDRFRFSVETMAGTVLGGAITTAGAGSFMFLCVQSFFAKMATLIVFTILYSVLYSLFWFMPLMAYIGPEGDFGHVDFNLIASKLGFGKKGTAELERSSL